MLYLLWLSKWPLHCSQRCIYLLIFLWVISADFEMNHSHFLIHKQYRISSNTIWWNNAWSYIDTGSKYMSKTQIKFAFFFQQQTTVPRKNIIRTGTNSFHSLGFFTFSPWLQFISRGLRPYSRGERPMLYWRWKLIQFTQFVNINNGLSILTKNYY